MDYTEALSRFIVDQRFDESPPDVIEVARKCILDWIGVTLGAVGQPAAALMKEIIEDMGGRQQASIIGYGTRTTMANAALVNGLMAHTLDYDDAHSGVRTHPSAPLVAAILAVAEPLGLSGRDVVAAFIVGCEVTLRIGYALGKAYYEQGWHSTAILGRFGAAAGVSRLLGLETKQVSMALGLTATQAGGLRDTFGTMAKPFHSGKAAMDGVLAAMFAQRGFTGPSMILDPQAGFARVFSHEYEPERLVTGLGTEFHTTGINFKPYAACLAVHPVIDALITLRQRNRLDVNLIREIRLSIAPFNLMVAGNPTPEDGLQAKFSIYMGAALAVVYGQATERFFTDEIVHDPHIRTLMAKVKAIPNETLAETEAIVRVFLEDGREESIHVTAPKGDPRNPLSFEDIAEKARDLGRNVLSEHALDSIVSLVSSLEGLDNAAKLVWLCCAENRF